MLAITMSLMASAQFQLGHKLVDRDAAFEYAKTHKATPYVNNSKAAGATVVVNSNTGLTVNATITPNADCVKYFAVTAETGVMEAVAQYYGLTLPYTISYFGQELTGTQTVTLDGATPNNVSNTVYVLAVGSTSDSNVVTADYMSNYLGGTGTANITTVVSNVTSTTVDLSYTINDQTSYFYYLIAPKDTLVAYGMPTTADVITYLEGQDDRNYVDLAGTVGGQTPLTTGVKYVAYGFAYNKNEVLGTYTAPISFIPGVGIVGLNDVETLSSSVYPNPAKDQVTFTTSSKMNKVEIFNMVGQKVYENNVNGIATSVNVSNFNAGSYIAKIYTQSGVATQRLIVK